MTDYRTKRRGGDLFIIWTCPACREDNDRILDCRPWQCLDCGYIDREVEAASSDLYAAEQRAANNGDVR